MDLEETGEGRKARTRKKERRISLSGKQCRRNGRMRSPYNNARWLEETKTIQNIQVTIRLIPGIFTEYIVPEQCIKYNTSPSRPRHSSSPFCLLHIPYGPPVPPRCDMYDQIHRRIHPMFSCSSFSLQLEVSHLQEPSEKIFLHPSRCEPQGRGSSL